MVKISISLSRIYKAIDEETVDLSISSLNDELKNILTDVEKSTLFQLDHLPENTTDEQLIADFTKRQDEYDDLTEKSSECRIMQLPTGRSKPWESTT